MDQPKQNKMAVMPIPRLVMNISLPLMISMLVQSLYNIVDGVFVARISEAALTATSLAYPAQLLMVAVSVGTGVGVNSLLSRKLGKKEYDGVNAVATNGLFLAVACALIFMLLGATCVPWFLGMFTDNQEILAMGTTYLRICMLFCIEIFVATTAERLLQATGNTFLSMVAQISGAVVNIILDPILIFGWFGLPELGITGAAVATFIGQWTAAILAIIFNFRKNDEIEFLIKGFRPDWQTIKDIYKVGIPTIIMQAMGSLMMVAMNRILVMFSTTAVAFFGVYYKLQNFLFMPVNGLAQGLIPIVGFNYGADDYKRVREAVRVSLMIAAGIMIAGTIIFMAIPTQLLTLFGAADAMMAIGRPALRIISVSFICVAVTVPLGYVFSGMGNGVVIMVSTLCRQLAVLVPVAYLFATRLGLEYTWYAFWISEGVAAVFTIICFMNVYRKKLRPDSQ